MVENTKLEDILEESEEFKINDSRTADWAMEKIKEARKCRDFFKETAEQKIAELKQKIEEAEKKCESRTAYLLGQLNQTQGLFPSRKTKTREVVELPAGKLVWKHAKQEFERDEEKLLPYLKENAPEYVEYVPKIKWGELKKDLIIESGIPVRKNTGEIPEGIRIIEKPESFDIE